MCAQIRDFAWHLTNLLFILLILSSLRLKCWCKLFLYDKRFVLQHCNIINPLTRKLKVKLLVYLLCGLKKTDSEKTLSYLHMRWLQLSEWLFLTIDLSLFARLFKVYKLVVQERKGENTNS